jgi:hypothetical protein
MGINATSVQELYVAYFNRPADPAGLAYWEKQLDDKALTLDGVAKFFAASKEYTDAFAGMNNTQIVNKIYINLFGHNADTAGLLYWVARLTSTGNDKLTIDGVVRNIAAGAQNEDKVAFSAKVSAATAFTDKVKATDGATAAYNGDAANAVAKGYITSVTDAATLAAATAKLADTMVAVASAADPLMAASTQAQAASAKAAVDAAAAVKAATDAAAAVTTAEKTKADAEAAAAKTDAPRCPKPPPLPLTP